MIKENILMFILGIAFLLNIITINFFPPAIEELTIVGVAILGVGALFYILSVFTLRRKGVGKVIDSGIYGVVRHPMYLGAIIMFFSHIFFSQNLMVIIGTIAAIICCYLIILSDEEQNLKKFGDDYKHYMKKVPRLNFIVGIIRLFHL